MQPHAARCADRRSRMRRFVLFAFAGVSGCSHSPHSNPPVDVPRTRTTDSIVLERTRCLGSCPSYRLRLSRTGEVVFVSHNPGEVGTTAVDTIGTAIVDSLERYAERIGFFTLPDSVIPGRTHCELVATDHPTIAIAFFGTKNKIGSYYTGCRLASDDPIVPAFRGVQDLAGQIDSLTHASRWIRPARR